MSRSFHSSSNPFKFRHSNSRMHPKRQCRLVIRIIYQVSRVHFDLKIATFHSTQPHPIHININCSFFLNCSSPAKPHSEYASSMEKLVGLKTNRQYASLEDIIDFAIEFSENSSNSLGNVDIFIKQLNGFLFTGRYLFDS